MVSRFAPRAWARFRRPLPSFRDVNRKAVAIVSVLVITVACGFAFAAGQLRLFEGGYEMSGVFKDTGGIKGGNDVRVAGVKVGRVESVKPDFAHGQVIITWSVSSDIRLGRQTMAGVQTATLLGGRYIKLSGPVAAPYLADLPAAQRRIPLDRTSVPFTVTDSINSATRIANGIDQVAINKILDETTKIKTPTREKLGQMLRNVNELATLLNDRNPEIQQLVANSKKITGTLAAKDAQLVRLINASRTLLDELVKRRNELAAAIGESSGVVRTLSQVIDQHEKEINSILGDVHTLTQRLAPNMDAFNAGWAQMGPTFHQVALTSDGPWINAVLTGFGPVQPPFPVSTPPGSGGG
jgi:phospholipid/cholesterol/gamma-HCH transport system substrate-binding protein